MTFGTQLSPGVQIREIDLTNFVPNAGASGGAFVGQFVWGPVKEYTVLNDANTLVKIFGKPTDANYVDWFSASNFLSYSDNLNVIRVVDGTSLTPAKNSTIDGSGILVENKDAYQKMIVAGTGSTEVFVAKYPGVIGDTIKVSLADSASFASWKYRTEFDFAPGTSNFARNLGAANDEVHVVVVDEDGKFTGTPGAILEKYSFLSKALNCKGLDNEPNFYGNVLNNTSKYVWYFSPVKGSADLNIASSITELSVTEGANYGKPLVVFDGDGIGASAIATVGSGADAGKVMSITQVNNGSGYTTCTATIVDSGAGATAQAVLGTGGNTGKITAIIPIDVGHDYYSSAVTITDGGSGATAHANLAATGILKTVTLNAPGTGYTVGDVLTVTGGTGSVRVATITGGGGTGPVGTIDTIVPGTGYATAGAATGVAATGGTGADATVNIVVGKAVGTITVDLGGSNYGTATVTLAAPIGGGSTATTGTATIVAGAITVIPVSAAGSGYTAAPAVTITPGGSGATAHAVRGAIGSANEGKIVSYVVDTQGSNYGNPQVAVAPTGAGAVVTVTLGADNASETNWGENCATATGQPRTFYSLNNVAEGAFSKNLSGGADGARASAADLIAGWNMFQNAEEVEVGLLFTGYAGGSSTSKAVIQNIIDNIAEQRRDCMVFISPNLSDVLNHDQVDATANVIDFLQDTVNGINRDTSFAVMDSGWKLQYDVFSDKYRWIPLNADTAGLCAQTETMYDAWWSPAGLTRGKIKNVISLAFNPNKSSRDQLYKANINSIVSFTGEGTVLYGDKTLQVKNSAFSFINVRRLFIVLEKAIGKAAKYQLFEFNDTFTRAQFVGIVDPYLRTVKAKRGVYDYRVLCDESNNTPDVIDRAEFVASIFIKPARSINFITLNFVAVRTGVEFSEVVGAV